MTNGRTLSVLVVEHDPRVVRQLRGQLQEHGIGSVPVSSPEEINDRLRHEKFDGVFFNWNHPGLDGRGLSHLIRTSPSNRNVPLVAMAPRRRPDLLGEAAARNVPFFLVKPFTDRELHRLLTSFRPVLEEEHCRYRRLPVRVPLSCSWNDGGSAGETINVSSTGLLLRLEIVPHKGCAISMHMDVPGEGWQLRMEGIVTRIGTNDQVGVRFVRPSRRGLNPLLRQATAQQQQEEQVCGIERRSFNAPGPAGSSLGSGDHPHRTPISSPPDPVLFLVADKDPQVRDALTAVLDRPEVEMEFHPSIARAARRFMEADNRVLIAGIARDTAADLLISLGVDEVAEQVRRRVLCLLPHHSDLAFRREIASRNLCYLVKPIPLPALILSLRDALREMGLEPAWDDSVCGTGESVLYGETVHRFDSGRPVHCFF